MSVKSPKSAFSALGLVRDRGGNTLILFALVLPLAMLTVSAAIDFSRGADAKVKIQTALDAAVLAGARMLSEGSAEKKEISASAKAVFDANISDSTNLYAAPPNATFKVVEKDGLLRGRAEAKLSGLFSSMLSNGPMDIAVTSEAGFNNLDIELAMMLDTTGSMKGQKLADLKKAAGNAIDVLIGAKTTPGNTTTRIALVPYSAAVNAGSYAAVASNGASADCVTERVGAEASTDDGPVLAPVSADSRAYCPDAVVMPLTNKAKPLKAAVDGFEAKGYTAGHIGVGWAYYMLSPKWSAVWPAKSKPAAYSDPQVLKVALLMTDGEFNTYYDGIGDPFNSGASKARSNQQARDLCEDMKNRDIVIYAIAFDAPSKAETMLRDCASSSGHYYDADTGAELVAAFESVADEIRNLRLTR